MYTHPYAQAPPKLCRICLCSGSVRGLKWAFVSHSNTNIREVDILVKTTVSTQCSQTDQTSCPSSAGALSGGPHLIIQKLQYSPIQPTLSPKVLTPDHAREHSLIASSGYIDRPACKSNTVCQTSRSFGRQPVLVAERSVDRETTLVVGNRKLPRPLPNLCGN